MRWMALITLDEVSTENGETAQDRPLSEPVEETPFVQVEHF